MEYWKRESDGKIFYNGEEAYLDSIEHEDLDTLEDYLLGAIDFDLHKLLHWAIRLDGFWEVFQDEITEARELIFEDNYTNWDSPEEDPDGNDNPFGSCFWKG